MSRGEYPLKKVTIAILLLLSAGAGATGAYFYLSRLQLRINTDWQQLSLGPSSRGVTLNSDAMFADIPLPEIKQLQGKAKFMPDGVSNHEVQLGYLVTVMIDNLDTSKIPAKYRKQKVERYKGGEAFTIMPVEQVVYEARLDFIIKDTDGFELLSLTSQPLNIFSGQENKFQATLENKVPISIARRTTEMVFSLYVKRCITCL